MNFLFFCLYFIHFLLDIRLKHSLHVASAYGHLDIVEYLIEHDADMTFVDKYGRSSIHWAITNKHYGVFVHLLNAGKLIMYLLLTISINSSNSFKHKQEMR